MQSRGFSWLAPPQAEMPAAKGVFNRAMAMIAPVAL